MEKIPVTSTRIASIGYDPDKKTLEVEFNQGGTYQYLDVPNSKFTEMKIAQSIGKFFQTEIKDKYEFVKLGK